MPRFTYKAKNPQSTTQAGIVEAATIKQAIQLLHDKGLFIINIKEQSETILNINWKRSRVTFGDLVHITRQLSTMITAGLTLVESLAILIAQIKKGVVKEVIGKIEDEVRGGKTFASALSKYPQVFPPVYIALVKAGEASGKLDVILSRLADNLEKSNDFKNKIRGALLYPAIIVTGMVTVASIVMTVVVPRLTSLYNEFGISLPLPTRILIFMSGLVTGYWWAIILLILIAAVSFIQFRPTPLGRHIIAAFSLNFPIFGPLIREATLVEVTRTLSILIDGGVPILTALEIAQNATSNILFKEAFIDAGKKVEKGFPLSEPFLENKIFPPILGQMVSVGEQTGKLGDSLFKLSKYFETEADTTVRTLTTLIEPTIMIALGLGVGFLVMAVLLPIYSLTSKF